MSGGWVCEWVERRDRERERKRWSDHEENRKYVLNDQGDTLPLPLAQLPVPCVQFTHSALIGPAGKYATRPLDFERRMHSTKSVEDSANERSASNRTGSSLTRAHTHL